MWTRVHIIALIIANWVTFVNTVYHHSRFRRKFNIMSTKNRVTTDPVDINRLPKSLLDAVGRMKRGIVIGLCRLGQRIGRSRHRQSHLGPFAAPFSRGEHPRGQLPPQRQEAGRHVEDSVGHPRIPGGFMRWVKFGWRKWIKFRSALTDALPPSLSIRRVPPRLSQRSVPCLSRPLGPFARHGDAASTISPTG